MMRRRWRDEHHCGDTKLSCHSCDGCNRWNEIIVWFPFLAFLSLLESFGTRPFGCPEPSNTGQHNPLLFSSSVSKFLFQGTAKGGTTDLWHILQRLNVGFSQYEINSTRIIQTKKELDFFSGVLCTPPPSLSSSSLLTGNSLPCSASVMKTFLKCPRHLIDQHFSSFSSADSVSSLALIKTCQQWLDQYLDQSLPSPLYTITASPSLLYEHESVSSILSSLITETNASPLFILLLRDPIQRTISLYNHWSIQEANSGNGYALPLEQLLELELDLLLLPQPQRLLRAIFSSLNSSPRTKASLISVMTSHSQLLLFMSQALSSISSLSHGRLNLRSYGLVLDAWYLPQIIRWTTTRWRGSASSSSLNLKGKLLIMKSEEFLHNRLDVLQSDLLPWLFPLNTSAGSRGDTSVESRHKPFYKISETILPKVQNMKREKLRESRVSETMRRRLSQFYSGETAGEGEAEEGKGREEEEEKSSSKMYPLEEFLYDLQRRGTVKIVPPLTLKDGEGRGTARRRVTPWWS
jgi:hypothetical protein